MKYRAYTGICQGGGLNFSWGNGGTQHLSGPKTLLETKDFTHPGGGWSPIAPFTVDAYEEIVRADVLWFFKYFIIIDAYCLVNLNRVHSIEVHT